MALSSCSFSGNAKAAKGAEFNALEQENLFLEDTEAHEEIFGQSKSSWKDLNVRKTIGSGDIEDYTADSSIPALGIQSKLGTTTVDIDATPTIIDTISVRFVAAVKVVDQNSDSVVNDDDLALMTAVWTRAMFNANGSVLKVEAPKTSLKAYTELSDGTDPSDPVTTIAAFNALKGTSYTHFIVYTISNIPVDTSHDGYDKSNCYLTAYLTIDPDGEGPGAPVQSRVVASTVDQKTHLSFDVDDAGGCFGVKKTASGFETFNKAAVNKSGCWASFLNVSFDASDEFIFVNRVVNNENHAEDFFATYGFERLRAGDPDYDGNHPNGYYGFTQSGESQFSICPSTSKFYLYVENSTNRIIPKQSITKTLTLNAGASGDNNWNKDGATFAVKVNLDKNGVDRVYSMSASGSVYTVTLTETPDDAGIIFLRMSSDGNTEWNHSTQLNFGDTGNNTYTINNPWPDNSDWSTARGSWGS